MAILKCLLVLCSVVYVMSNSKDFSVDQMDGDCCVKCECIEKQSGYEVDCSNRSLNEVPRCQWQNVTRLNLRENNIKDISKDTFQRFKNIQALDLSENRLSYLPDPSFTMANLEDLNLDSNKFTALPITALSRMPNLKILYLSHNCIKDIDSRWEQRQLEMLELESNNIETMPVFAPGTMPRLKDLLLASNRIEVIPENAFENINNLERLDFTKNVHLKYFPYGSIRKKKNLKHLKLRDTNITDIPDLAFEGLDKLLSLDLAYTGHSKRNVKIGSKAFAHLPDLTKLFLSGFGLQEFPDLTGSYSLEDLKLDGNQIKTLPDNLCETVPNLEELQLNSNKVQALPSLSRCSTLWTLFLDGNNLQSFGNSLHGLESLLDLVARSNKIQSIGENDFKGLKKLEHLNLEDNEISSIHENAFASFQRILFLDLSGNNFPELPTQGLGTITTLFIKGNKKLTKFPSLRRIPKLKKVVVYYPYHCCALQNVKIEEEIAFGDSEGPLVEETWIWLSSNDSHFFSSGEIPTEPEKETSDKIECTPEPDPFFPCDDLMGDWVLRCGVWIVFILAVCGNTTVIIVILASHTKMDVSRFLISNLAFADLFMGIYLGFLAVVDISTFGNFKNYGVEWQMSPGCHTAGFLAVLSSELSVFTLTVITLERYIAIKNAIRVNRKLQLKTAIIVMIFGWMFALATASLPLLEVNNYGKFSICLPFEIGDTKSIVFLVFLLCLNAAAFMVILFCYILMYCSIRGSNAWNASDFRVAKRMALLVFTDFACWAPIVFLSLTAAFGSTIVNLEQAKIFTVFVFPLNSCANPFLYAIFTSHFKKDLLGICKRVEEKYPFLKITKQRLSFSRRSSYSGAMSENPNVFLRIRRFSLPVSAKGLTNSITTNGRASDSLNSNKNSSEVNAIVLECNKQLLTERETSV